MKLRRRNNLLVEPPSAATGDIAFNLIVFFLVCASVQPDSGRKQSIPKSESKTEKQQQSENIEVSITRTAAAINGSDAFLDPLTRTVPRSCLPPWMTNASKDPDLLPGRTCGLGCLRGLRGSGKLWRSYASGGRPEVGTSARRCLIGTGGRGAGVFEAVGLQAGEGGLESWGGRCVRPGSPAEAGVSQV